jgi:hypothetical protein
MNSTTKRKSIQGFVRKFEDEQDADYIRMRMIAIREAQQTMERGSDERSNLSVFLA